VEEEAFAQCQTGLTVLLGTVCEPLIIHLMEGPLMVPSLGQAVAGSHGVEAVEESLVAGEGSVVGDNKKIVFAWGPSMEPNPLTPLGGKGNLPNGRHG
jgi:hypothetical protein